MWSRRRENRPRGVDGSPSTDNHSTQKGEVAHYVQANCNDDVQLVVKTGFQCQWVTDPWGTEIEITEGLSPKL